MSEPSTSAQRLAALVAYVREGCSIVGACRVLHVSQRTVWLQRRSNPEFAAALHEAEAISRDIRKGERDDDLRERLAAHALELAKGEREGCESRKQQRGGTKRERRLRQQLHGVNTSLFPGCSPSSKAESSDPLERIRQRQTRASMAEAFAERRKERAGKTGNAGNTQDSPADAAPSGSSPPPGSAFMTAREVQLLLGLVSDGSTADNAARKLGLSRDDIIAHRDCTPGFALLLGETLGAGSEAHEGYRQQRKAPAGNTADSDAAPRNRPRSVGRRACCSNRSLAIHQAFTWFRRRYVETPD